jgi:hypothetical protein
MRVQVLLLSYIKFWASLGILFLRFILSIQWKCSLLTLVAVAAWLLSFHYLLASGICHPLAFQTFIYANSFHHQSLDPEDGGSMDLQNVGILPEHYTVPQPRRTWIFTTVETTNLASFLLRYHSSSRILLIYYLSSFLINLIITFIDMFFYLILYRYCCSLYSDTQRFSAFISFVEISCFKLVI